MKIIDAYWEKRNLGVTTTEILVEDTDTKASIVQHKELFDNVGYIVIKVPTQRFDICSALSEFGFSFIEGSINFELQLKQAQLTPLQVRTNNSVTYTEMTPSDLETLYSEINNGLFGTDRILIDPAFSPKIAALRYINWISDELLKGTQVYKICYKDEAIGFFTFKSIAEGVYYPFLAGMYKKFANSGLGFTTLRKPIDEAILRGGKLISTYASSNNLPVVRAHTQQGFSINKIYYVFVKHNKI